MLLMSLRSPSNLTSPCPPGLDLMLDLIQCPIGAAFCVNQHKVELVVERGGGRRHHFRKALRRGAKRREQENNLLGY